MRLKDMQALGILEPIGPVRADVVDPPSSSRLRYLRNSNLVSRVVAGETVVVPICRGVGDLDSIFTFNGVGTFLWGLLVEGRSESELAAFVARRFAVAEEAALADVRSFLAELKQVGLVQTV
ncbi:MAG TPA: PqqD family protein [Candidatus Acidoferrum sp.]|nr:PqqD family protein [Candidatus Acidoferrum sp.]